MFWNLQGILHLKSFYEKDDLLERIKVFGLTFHEKSIIGKQTSRDSQTWNILATPWMFNSINVIQSYKIMFQLSIKNKIRAFDIKIHMKPNTFDHNKMLDSTNNLINLFEDLVLTSLIQNSTFLCNVIRFQLYFLIFVENVIKWWTRKRNESNIEWNKNKLLATMR